jgi:hypothetical protein
MYATGPNSAMVTRDSVVAAAKLGSRRSWSKLVDGETDRVRLNSRRHCLAEKEVAAVCDRYFAPGNPHPTPKNALEGPIHVCRLLPPQAFELPPAFRWPRWVPRYRLTVVSGPPAGPPPLAIAAVGPPRSLYIVYPGPLTVFTPQPREAGGGAEFQRSRLLLPCHI